MTDDLAAQRAEAIERAAEALREIRDLMAEARVQLFDEYVGRGYKPRAAFMMVRRRCGYDA